MSTTLRTFRLTAALMAVLMLLSGSLPLVQHACAMAQRHESEHACPRHGHDEAPMHHGTHDHGSMHAAPEAAPPCDHDTSRQTAPHDCCTVEAATGVTANSVRLLKRSQAPLVVLAVAAAVPVQDSGVSNTLFFDTGPPPAASVALHLVHSVLLN